MREITRWGDLYNQNLENDTIVVYGRSDSSGAASVWATFLGNYSEADLQNKSDANVSGDQAIAQSVIRDKNSISFTNLNYVFEPVSGGYNHTIRPVPIDLNENGRLDENESFYHKREAFLENVAKGLYPSPPTRDEFLVGRGSFEGAVKDFIEWILTDGQNFLEENGYIRLLENERELEAAFLERGSRE